MLTIRDLSKATGTKVETVRYYERVGLLSAPARTEGNYRAYKAADLNRLSFIRRARDLGFSLDDIRALLSLADDKSQPCAGIDALVRHHLQEVERKIMDLARLRQELASMIDACQGSTIAHCRIIEALGPAQSSPI